MPLLRTYRPRSIVVLRALQIGDMLCAVPALRALRNECPHASITLVGLPWARSLPDRLSRYLDDFIPFPGFPGFPEQPAHPPGFARFVLDVRSRAFDLAVQMHGDGRISNRVARLLGARRIAGFRRAADAAADADAHRDAGRRNRDAWLRYPDHGHEVRRLLALTRFLGCEQRDESLEFPLLPADVAELRESGLARTLAPGRYVCVHPGARAADRRWPAEHFAEVADALHQRYGLPIVVTGSQHERALCAEVRARMRAPAIDAAAPITIGALAALLADARLLVANDTGVSHLASALHVPSVIVFTASDPARWAPLDTDLHRAVVNAGRSGPQAVLAEAHALMTPPLEDLAHAAFRPPAGAVHRIRAGSP
ncbi:MAG TPA: glycosyltransferase family 9 protein [Zeimonas sp.]